MDFAAASLSLHWATFPEEKEQLRKIVEWCRMKLTPLQASPSDRKGKSMGKDEQRRANVPLVGRRETLFSAKVLATFKVVVSSVVCASSYIQEQTVHDEMVRSCACLNSPLSINFLLPKCPKRRQKAWCWEIVTAMFLEQIQGIVPRLPANYIAILFFLAALFHSTAILKGLGPSSMPSKSADPCVGKLSWPWCG